MNITSSIRRTQRSRASTAPRCRSWNTSTSWRNRRRKNTSAVAAALCRRLPRVPERAPRLQLRRRSGVATALPESCDAETLALLLLAFARTQVVERFRLALELFLGIIRRLDRETDPALDLVHLDDTGFHFLADLEHVLHFRDVILAELGNVNEPVDVVLQLHERTEARQLRDLALHEIADLVFRIDLFPRIVAQLFNAEADPLVHLVDVDHDRFHFVVLLKDFARVIDLPGPAQIGDVDHAIDSVFEFHERAIRGHVADRAFHMAADRKFLLDLIPRIRFELTQSQ